MNGSKSPFTSAGIIGPAVAIISIALKSFGWDAVISDADVNTIAAVVGSLVGIWGRWRATKAVKLFG